MFAGLTNVTDRQTDHATLSETTGRIHVRGTAMQPKSWQCVCDGDAPGELHTPWEYWPRHRLAAWWRWRDQSEAWASAQPDPCPPRATQHHNNSLLS